MNLLLMKLMCTCLCQTWDNLGMGAICHGIPTECLYCIASEIASITLFCFPLPLGNMMYCSQHTYNQAFLVSRPLFKYPFIYSHHFISLRGTASNEVPSQSMPRAAEVDVPMKRMLYSHWHGLLDTMKEIRRMRAPLVVEVIDMNTIHDRGTLVSTLQDIKVTRPCYSQVVWFSCLLQKLLHGSAAK
jgi:hypothetical protein